MLRQADTIEELGRVLYLGNPGNRVKHRFEDTSFVAGG
jgi:hypothetical protein